MLRSPIILLVALLATFGCDDGVAPECAAPADCGAVETPCAGCPPLADALCLEGVCAERAADAVDVIATINLDRNIANDVESVVHVVADVLAADGPLTCENAFESGAIAARVNIFSTGYKALSGGSFHPDVNLGRAPDVAVAVLLVATDQTAGEGSVVATGCSLSFTSGDIIDVDP